MQHLHWWGTSAHASARQRTSAHVHTTHPLYVRSRSRRMQGPRDTVWVSRVQHSLSHTHIHCTCLHTVLAATAQAARAPSRRDGRTFHCTAEASNTKASRRIRRKNFPASLSRPATHSTSQTSISSSSEYRKHVWCSRPAGSFARCLQLHCP